MNDTTPLSHSERVEAEVCPACNAHRAKEERYWNRQSFWQKLGTIFTFFAFAAAAIYACFAHQQVAQMVEANKWTRLMLVGTQAAQIEMDFTLSPSGEFRVGLANVGHIAATNVRVRIEATRQRIADSTIIETPAVLNYSRQFLNPVPAGDFKVWTLPWRPRELTTKDEWPKEWPGPETLAFDGELSYQNGLGDDVHQTLCQKWIPRFSIKYKLQGMGGGGLIPCSDFENAIRATQEQEKRAENGADRP